MISTVTKDSLKRKNFQPDEFFTTSTGKKNETDSLSILSCLMLVADKIQEVRDLLQKPIKITSAYRCLEVNRAVGSKDSSQHIQGQAVDFQCKEFGDPEKIVKFLMERKVVVDQCLIESRWVHLSITHNKNRNQFGKLIDGKFSIL